MNNSGKQNPESHTNIFFLERVCDRKNGGKYREVPRVEILIRDVKRGTSNGDREQRGDHDHRSPLRPRIGEALTADIPASGEQQEDGNQMPREHGETVRQMSDAHRVSDDL